MSDTKHWYRGNLHAHSFWSDGGNWPEMIAAWFKDAGYHFLALTEHDLNAQVGERWIPTSPDTHQGRVMQQGDLLAPYQARFGADWVERRAGPADTTAAQDRVRLKPLYEYRHLVEEAGRFLLLDGEEITVRWGLRGNEPAGTHWMNVINAPELIAPQSTPGGSAAAMQQTVQTAAALAQASGRPMFVFLNHPNYVWNAVAEEIAAAEGLRFIEIHTALNVTYPYGDGQRAGAERIWDIVLTERLSRPDGQVIYGLATDDSHFYHDQVALRDHEGYGSHPGRAWVMVHAARLTPESLVNALLAGDYYCSNGVTLRTLETSGGRLSVGVEPEPGVAYRIQFIGTRRGADRTSQPVVDAQGQPLVTTRRYGPEIGQVLRTVTGVEAHYDLQDELYVRAVVYSDRPHPKPTAPGDVQKAWTQPLSRPSSRP